MNPMSLITAAGPVSGTGGGASSPSATATSGLNSSGSVSSAGSGDFSFGGFSNKTLLIVAGAALLGLYIWRR
jgi:hypothetical protein